MRRRAQLALLAVVVVAGAFLGWREFWFLTDDAFIGFPSLHKSAPKTIARGDALHAVCVERGGNGHGYLRRRRMPLRLAILATPRRTCWAA